MTSHLELTKRIIDARDAYYGDGSTSLTDDEYDALLDELRMVDPNSDILKQVGAEPVSEFPKVKHEIPMGSLNKVQNEEQFNSWADKTSHDELLLTEKLDGISIAVEFRNGNIVKAITRGDGITGEDITQNVKKMKARIDQGSGPFIGTYEPYTGWVRGEIVLLKHIWQRYMPDMKNPRNAAAGTAKRLDGEGCEHLSIKFYYATPTEHENWTHKSSMIAFIGNKLKLDTTGLVGVIPASEVPAHVKTWENHRDEIDYNIDGIVVEVNLIEKFEELGEVDSCPKGAVAYKFPPKQTITKVKSITWQIGRTGRVTPVAEIEPVDIDGVTISRVSLHTARIALDSQAGPGATVVVSRRNDVIPYIEKVLQPTNVQDPAVHQIKDIGKVRWEGEYLVVDQMEDKTFLYNSVKVWVQRLRVLHWGDSFINILMGYELVKSLPDIYRLDWNLVAQFAGDGIAKRARESLERSGNNIDFASFISALGIRFCDSLAKNLVEAGIDTPDKLAKSNVQQLTNIEGIGATKAEAIRKSIVTLTPVIYEMGKIISFTERTGSMVGKSFCFTGAMKHQRKELESMVLNNGGEVKSSVSKGLSFLVLADPDSGSTKANKARSLGTTCISEDQFLEMCSV